MGNSKAVATKNGFDLSEQVLNQLPTTVMAVDKDLNLIFLNKTGENVLGKRMEELKGKKCSEVFNSAHCSTDECCMVKAIDSGDSHSARNEINVNGQNVPIEYFAAPLKNESGEIIGGLEYVLDITERVKHENKLKEQAQTIREISTPAINLWEGVVVLPVVGIVDSMRAQQMMEKMLEKIVSSTARIIILDISGVAAVDTAVANHLIKITKATKLMGCQCIISGITPAVAQTIVQLGINMQDIQTNSTLSDALAEAFKFINLEVISSKSQSGK